MSARATDVAAHSKALNVEFFPTHAQVDAALAAFKERRELAMSAPPLSTIGATNAAIALYHRVLAEASVLPFDRNSLITLEQAFLAGGLSATTASNYIKALKHFALYAGFAEFWAYRSPAASLKEAQVLPQRASFELRLARVARYTWTANLPGWFARSGLGRWSADPAQLGIWIAGLEDCCLAAAAYRCEVVDERAAELVARAYRDAGLTNSEQVRRLRSLRDVFKVADAPSTWLERAEAEIQRAARRKRSQAAPPSFEDLDAELPEPWSEVLQDLFRGQKRRTSAPKASNWPAITRALRWAVPACVEAGQAFRIDAETLDLTARAMRKAGLSDSSMTNARQALIRLARYSGLSSESEIETIQSVGSFRDLVEQADLAPFRKGLEAARAKGESILPLELQLLRRWLDQTRETTCRVPSDTIMARFCDGDRKSLQTVERLLALAAPSHPHLNAITAYLRTTRRSTRPSKAEQSTEQPSLPDRFIMVIERERSRGTRGTHVRLAAELDRFAQFCRKRGHEPMVTRAGVAAYIERLDSREAHPLSFVNFLEAMRCYARHAETDLDDNEMRQLVGAYTSQARATDSRQDRWIDENDVTLSDMAVRIGEHFAKARSLNNPNRRQRAFAGAAAGAIGLGWPFRRADWGAMRFDENLMRYRDAWTVMVQTSKTGKLIQGQIHAVAGAVIDAFCVERTGAPDPFEAYRQLLGQPFFAYSDGTPISQGNIDSIFLGMLGKQSGVLRKLVYNHHGVKSENGLRIAMGRCGHKHVETSKYYFTPGAEAERITAALERLRPLIESHLS